MMGLKNMYFAARKLLLVSLLTLSLPYAIKAQNSTVVLGGGSGQLRITVRDNGSFLVERETSPGNGVWAKQMFRQDASPFFGIKIGATFFNSYQGGFAIGEDVVIVGGAENTRTELSKTFRHTYSGKPFSVTITTIYDTSNPEYFILSAKIDTRGIEGVPVSLAYGYDAYVNNNDAGYAFIIPDTNGYNNISPELDVYFSQAEIRTLQLVASINGSNQGAFMGFFNMGRAFDRAYSANPYADAYPVQLVNNTNNFKFQFGPFGSGKDNGVGVVFDGIPSNSIQVVNTGLTFSGTLDGTLDYTWNGVKDKTVNLNDIATLNLDYKTYSLTPLAGIAFRVDFPGLAINGSCTHSGWTSIGTSTCDVGNEYYKVADASIEVNGQGYINVPIEVLQYGQWEVNAGLISETARTLPTGEPAILRARTDINLTSTASSSICRGSGATYTVTLDGTSDKTTSQNIVVNLSYAGDTEQFNLPASVTIPAGAHSASFTIEAKPTAADNSSVTFTLDDIDYPSDGFATVGSVKSATVSVKHTPMLTSSTTIPATCGLVEYTATGSSGTTIVGWSRAAVTGITPAAGSGSGASISETLDNGSDNPKTVTYTYTLTHTNGCTSTQDVTVEVKPVPGVSSPTAVAICSGEDVGYAITSNLSGATFEWTRATNPNINGGTGGNGTSSTISEVLTSSSTNPVAVAYTITPTLNGCTGAPETVTVTVNPTPKLSNVSKVMNPICRGSTASYTATSATTGTTFSWQRLAASGITPEPSGVATNSATISEVLTNTTSAPITVTYVYTLTANGCTNTETVTVVVNSYPAPTISGAADVWQNGVWTYTTEPGKYSYQWVVTGGTVESGQGSSSVTVRWGSGTTGTIKVSYREESASGCLVEMASPKEVSIVNSQLEFTLSEGSVNEGSSVTGRICLPPTTVAPPGGISVSLAAKNTSTATADDYNMPASVLIEEGQSCVEFTVEAKTDLLLEGDEQLTIVVSAASLNNAEATLTIVDRTDGTIVVEKYKPIDEDASEPSKDGSFLIHFAETGVTCTKDVKVNFTVVGADSPTDYEVVTSSDITTTTAIIRGGQNGVEVPIKVNNNFIVQGKRTLEMRIVNILP